MFIYPVYTWKGMVKYMNKKDIVEAAIWRSAIKNFDINKKISEEDFKLLLQVAQYSPSSFGLEPWNIIVLQNSELRENIMPYASGAQNQLRTASHFVIFTVKRDLLPTSKYFKNICTNVKKMEQEAYFNFVSTFSAFVETKQKLTNQRERIDWAGKQSYIALGNMMNAAALMGIDSCPIEGFIADEIENILEKNGKFSSDIDKIVVMAAFGYRVEEPKHIKARRNIDEIVRIID